MILYELEFATTVQQHDGFVSLLNRTMEACRQEPGCLMYRFSADVNDTLRHYLSEGWEDEAALLAHVAAPAFLAFIRELPGCGRVISSMARQGDLVPYERPAA